MNTAWFEQSKSFLEDKFYRVPHLKKDPMQHAMSVFQILRNEYAISDPDVLVAGILHDVLEDTLAREEEISGRFSPRALEFIKEVSHDHGDVYDRDAFYERLKNVSLDAKWIKLADVKTNLLWMIDRLEANNPVFRSHAPYIRHVRVFLSACQTPPAIRSAREVEEFCQRLEYLDAQARKSEEWL